MQIEIKRGANSGGWHPHGHALLLCDQWLDFQAASAEWSRILGYSAQSRFQELYPDEKGSYRKACNEVVKYQCKFDSMNFAQVWEAHRAVKRNERLLSSYGCLRGGAEECESDYLEECESGAEGLPYVERVYRWLKGQYTLTEVTYHDGSNA